MERNFVKSLCLRLELVESHLLNMHIKKVYTEEIKQKLSYFKYYPRWQWVIAVGVYVDDIEEEITEKKILLQKKSTKTSSTKYFTIFTIFIYCNCNIYLSFTKKLMRF